MRSPDLKASDVWVTGCATGLVWASGSSQVVNLHVWGNGTGMTGISSGAQWRNVYIETNDGWGADFSSNMDRADLSGLNVWANGAGSAGTGGIRVKPSSHARGWKIEGTFNDNTGTGLVLDGTADVEVDAVFLSQSVIGGGSPLCDTGIQITATSVRTKLNARGLRADHLTAVLSDASPSSSVEFASVKTFLAADVVMTNSVANVALTSLPVRENERWLIEGELIVDGPQAADVAFRVQGTSMPGVVGWFALVNNFANSLASTSSGSLNPTNVTDVKNTAGTNLAAGLAGVGTKQLVGLRGALVTDGSANGSIEVSARQLVADAVSTTVYKDGSWFRFTRVA